MFERFTEKAIRVVMLSQEEFRRMAHNHVGSEQVLLGLLSEGTGLGWRVLRSAKFTLKETRAIVEKVVGRGMSGCVPG